MTTAPYFAIVGGDVSYDNGCRYCFIRWDGWFQKWSTNMTVWISSNGTSHLYNLPLLTAVGKSLIYLNLTFKKVTMKQEISRREEMMMPSTFATSLMKLKMGQD